jgi:hypothetical protein
MKQENEGVEVIPEFEKAVRLVREWEHGSEFQGALVSQLWDLWKQQP